LFPGGIVENTWLFTGDFRIPKCQNPFLALPDVQVSLHSNFQINSTNATSFDYNATNATNSSTHGTHTRPYYNEDHEINREMNQYANWVMKTYDLNRDGLIDETEGQRLLNDALESSVNINEVNAWIYKFDANQDGKLSIKEVVQALDN